MTRWLAAAGALLLGAVAWVVFKASVNQAPWMTDVRVVGDLGEQSIPFLAYYRDVLTGRANGDLLYAWGMTYGQSFIGTFAQYLSNPFNTLVVLFPRTHAPQALFAVQVAMGAATAGAMSLLLSGLRPGWWSLNLVLAVGWATIPFLTLDASYHPYWGVGAMVMPLMVVSAHWVRDGRRAWAVTPLFGLAFVANFYTAYMAAIGAGLMVVALMAANPEEWPRPVRTLLAWAVRAGLGAAVAAVLIIPTWFAVQQSARPPEPGFDPGRLVDWVAAMLPGADTISRAPSWTPALPIMTLVVLALAAAPARARLVWGGMLGLALLSMFLPPTSLLWHGGDVPDGNFFRQAWVVAGIAVVALWQLAPSLAEAARRPGGRIRLAAAGLGVAVAVALSAVDATVVEPQAAILGGLLALAATAVVVGGGLGRRWGDALLLALLAIAVLVGQGSAVDRLVGRANVVIDFAWLHDRGPAIDRALAAGRGASAGIDVTLGRTMNDPLLLGGSGLSGYTTMMPMRSASMATVAGATVRAGGRRIFTLGNPLEHALFGVQDAARVERSQARWVSATVARDVRAPDSLADFYVAHLADAIGPAVLSGGAAGTSWRGTVSCPEAAGVLYADGSLAVGRLTVGSAADELPPRNAWRGRLVQVATLDGPWPVEIEGPAAADPASVLFCASAQPTPGGEAARIERSGHGFVVEAPDGPGEDLVVATPYSPEWQCRTADGRSARTYDHTHLLGVQAQGNAVSCTFTPAGLVLGAALSGSALIGWAGLVAWQLLRRRRVTDVAAG